MRQETPFAVSENETQSIPDAFGVPKYYVTTFFAEMASPGDVRLYGCSKTNGVLVPEYIAIIPVDSVIRGTALMRDVAIAIMKYGADGLLH